MIAAIMFFGSARELLAANGDSYSLSWIQREGDQNLATVSRQFRQYRDTTPDTCYGGANWCCKTTTESVKLSHDHLDTDVNGDLSATEKTRADTGLEWTYAWASSSNRKASASAVTNCHGWALDRSSVWLVDSSTMFSKDYTSKSLGNLQVGDRCAHQTNHTSKITELGTGDCDEQVVTKVEQKCGRYGRYETGPNDITEYGGPVGYWRKN